MKKIKHRTVEDQILAVVGNGLFEPEDVAHVQALAQLGARVLEILTRYQAQRGEWAAREALEVARSLGLLGEEVKP